MRWAVLVIGCIIGTVVVGVLVVDFWVLGDDEVATLWTRSSDGESYETQVWVVDGSELDGSRDGSVWMRAHSGDARWLRRLRVVSEVELERGDELLPYTASLPAEDAALREELNRAMAEKYALADRVIAWMADPGHSIPVRLDPDPTRTARRAGGAHGEPH